MHVAAHVSDAEKLQVSRGRVPCPSAGGGASGCPASWDVGDLGSKLDAATLLAFAQSLVGLHFDAPRLKAEREAARASAEAAAREAGIALAERVRRLRQLIVERDLTLHCPRCGGAFNDYTGCNALVCGSQNERGGVCGAGFCGVCMLECGRDAHQHYYAVHGQDIHNRAVFDNAHRSARLARVVVASRPRCAARGIATRTQREGAQERRARARYARHTPRAAALHPHHHAP